MSVFSTNKYNLEMWQGATFGLTITVKDAEGATQNLTNYSARMQLRSDYTSGSVSESLTSSNGEISIVPAEGNLIFELSATRTANIHVDLSNGKPPKTVYVYDLELVDNSTGVVSKLLYGDVNVYGEVTR
jgi:hypothetical protein